MAHFRDRNEAAKVLISLLPASVDRDWIILGLARGGIPVAARIAEALGAPLEVLIVRKVGVPGNPELAVAAVTGPGPERMVVNETVRRFHRLTPDEVNVLSGPAVAEVNRRRTRWLGGASELSLQWKRVLIVDDGMATGTTMLAAIRVARQLGASQIGVAVPVALGTSLHSLPADIAPVVCPYPSDPESGVGSSYAAFPQITDNAVISMIKAARRLSPMRSQEKSNPRQKLNPHDLHDRLEDVPQPKKSQDEHVARTNPRR